MSVRAAKLNLAAAILNTFGPAYNRDKRMLLPAERAAFDASVKLSCKQLLEPKEAKAVIQEHDAELERRRAQAIAAREERQKQKLKGAAPSNQSDQSNPSTKGN